MPPLFGQPFDASAAHAARALAPGAGSPDGSGVTLAVERGPRAAFAAAVEQSLVAASVKELGRKGVESVRVLSRDAVRRLIADAVEIEAQAVLEVERARLEREVREDALRLAAALQKSREAVREAGARAKKSARRARAARRAAARLEGERDQLAMERAALAQLAERLAAEARASEARLAAVERERAADAERAAREREAAEERAAERLRAVCAADAAAEAAADAAADAAAEAAADAVAEAAAEADSGAAGEARSDEATGGAGRRAGAIHRAPGLRAAGAPALAFDLDTAGEVRRPRAAAGGPPLARALDPARRARRAAALARLKRTLKRFHLENRELRAALAETARAAGLVPAPQGRGVPVRLRAGAPAAGGAGGAGGTGAGGAAAEGERRQAPVEGEPALVERRSVGFGGAGRWARPIDGAARGAGEPAVAASTASAAALGAGAVGAAGEAAPLPPQVQLGPIAVGPALKAALEEAVADAVRLALPRLTAPVAATTPAFLHRFEERMEARFRSVEQQIERVVIEGRGGRGEAATQAAPARGRPGGPDDERKAVLMTLFRQNLELRKAPPPPPRRPAPRGRPAWDAEARRASDGVGDGASDGASDGAGDR